MRVVRSGYSNEDGHQAEDKVELTDFILVFKMSFSSVIYLFSFFLKFAFIFVKITSVIDQFSKFDFILNFRSIFLNTFADIIFSFY